MGARAGRAAGGGQASGGRRLLRLCETAGCAPPPRRSAVFPLAALPVPPLPLGELGGLLLRVRTASGSARGRLRRGNQRPRLWWTRVPEGERVKNRRD